MSEEIQQTEAPGLSIQDLIQVVKLIQIANQRGAVHVNEMSSVGALYDRMIAFLDANGAIDRTPPAQENQQ
jgi:hypothetical protein